jgi:CBS domain-containing protein
MKVKEIMTENPAYATVGTSLHDVAQMMIDYDCGCIPVLENKEDRKPIGVITDRDITVRTIAHNKDPLNMVAGEVMTDNIVTITPEMNIEDCIAKMEGNQIRRIVVVDDDGNLCGIVAQADIARQVPSFETAELVRDVSMSVNA